MFGQGAHKEEDAVLREIIRSVDKKLDYTVRDVEGSRFNLHLSLKGHEATVSLTLDELTAAMTDAVKRHHIRQKIKARRDHMDDSDSTRTCWARNRRDCCERHLNRRVSHSGVSGEGPEGNWHST
ncbi:MAG TPA: hypothetical protein VFM35_07270 [Candidatus Binatia bacterium]|nr:hypothetical protein [Candidatus Binatia bacterium]